MKQKSLTRYILRITLTLLLIASIVGAALALVNQITKPIIENAEAEKIQNAIAQVLPGGYDTEITAFEDPSGLVSKVYQGQNGYAVEVNPVGFDSAITLMVGVSFQGEVIGISVVSHSETAGLGAVAAAASAAGVAFRAQFVGRSGQVAVTKDGGNIDAITGATVTSRAVCNGVNAALECVALLAQGGGV